MTLRVSQVPCFKKVGSEPIASSDTRKQGAIRLIDWVSTSLDYDLDCSLEPLGVADHSIFNLENAHVAVAFNKPINQSSNESHATNKRIELSSFSSRSFSSRVQNFNECSSQLKCAHGHLDVEEQSAGPPEAWHDYVALLIGQSDRMPSGKTNTLFNENEI